MPSVPSSPVSPDIVNNVRGSGRQQVGQEGDPATTGGSSSASTSTTVPPEHHDASRSEAVEIHGEEEAQPQRVVKTPYTPTKAEMAEHRANGHIPYRCWCPDCVEGFGREWAHTRSGIERDFPLVSCDYLYITQS